MKLDKKWEVIFFRGAKPTSTRGVSGESRRKVIGQFSDSGEYTTAVYLPRIVSNSDRLHRLSHTKAKTRSGQQGGMFYTVLSSHEIKTKILEATAKGTTLQKRLKTLSHQQRLLKHRLDLRKLPIDLRNRIFEIENDCWLLVKLNDSLEFKLDFCPSCKAFPENWQSYSRVSMNGKQHSAHRLVYSLLVSHVSSELPLLHECDNRQCVNPAHLTIGTSSDNLNDMMTKGRHMSQRISKHSIVRRISLLTRTERAAIRRISDDTSDHLSKVENRTKVALEIAANHSWKFNVTAAVIAAMIFTKCNICGGILNRPRMQPS